MVVVGAIEVVDGRVEEALGIEFEGRDDLALEREFGIPEALWVIQVKDFPVVVTMDSHGGSLHAEVEKASKAKLDQLLA